MILPAFRSPQIQTYVDDVAGAIDAQRVNVASVIGDLPREAVAIAEELRDIAETWNPVELYTADNFEEQRDAFLDTFDRGHAYVPVFRYGRAETFDAAGPRGRLTALRARAEALPDEGLRDAYARATLLAKIDDDLATCDMAQGMAERDDALVKRGCRMKYPGGDPSLTAFATEMFAYLSQYTVADGPAVFTPEERAYLRSMDVSPERQKEAFTWALKRYGIYREDDDAEGDGFRVVLDPLATALDVRDKSRLGSAVYVPTDRDGGMDASQLCALIAHEISGHARQAVNGKRLFGVQGIALRVDDETLYEGLAIRYEWEFVERYFGEVRHDMDRSTLYIFAVDMAEKGASFGDIFRDQLERRIRLALKIPVDKRVPTRAAVDPALYDLCMKKAWRVTYRVMRGHVDMTNAHGFAMAKDLAYLRGWLMDRQLIESGHGHANEAAILSTDGLRLLSNVELLPDDIPIPFEDIAAEYARMLLAERA